MIWSTLIAFTSLMISAKLNTTLDGWTANEGISLGRTALIPPVESHRLIDYTWINTLLTPYFLLAFSFKSTLIWVLVCVCMVDSVGCFFFFTCAYLQISVQSESVCGLMYLHVWECWGIYSKCEYLCYDEAHSPARVWKCAECQRAVSADFEKRY